MTTWWMKLGGNRPPGDNPLLFSTSGTGSFICPVAYTRLDIPKPLMTQSRSTGGKVKERNGPWWDSNPQLLTTMSPKSNALPLTLPRLPIKSRFWQTMYNECGDVITGTVASETKYSQQFDNQSPNTKQIHIFSVQLSLICVCVCGGGGGGQNLHNLELELWDHQILILPLAKSKHRGNMLISSIWCSCRGCAWRYYSAHRYLATTRACVKSHYYIHESRSEIGQLRQSTGIIVPMGRIRRMRQCTKKQQRYVCYSVLDWFGIWYRGQVDR